MFTAQDMKILKETGKWNATYFKDLHKEKSPPSPAKEKTEVKKENPSTDQKPKPAQDH